MSREHRTRSGSQIGFSLVELLIVMGILLTISAIAVPYYLSAVQVAHEAAAVGFLRHLREAQESHRTTHGEYAESFEALGAQLNVRVLESQPPQWARSVLGVGVALAAPLQGQGQGTGPNETPPGQGGTPPGQGETPPGQGVTPPGQEGTPPGQGGIPPGQGGSPPGQASPPPSAGPGTTSASPPADSLVRSMYIFRLTRETPLDWHCIAEPLRDRTANKFFYIDASGVLRYSSGALPTAQSSPL
jgi:prepilin-type N-terminal cleavage/methylation domain-containing protein